MIHFPSSLPARIAVFLLLATYGEATAQQALVVEIENIVQTGAGKTSSWVPATKDQPLAVGDRVRTRQRSRAILRLTDLYNLRMDDFTTLELTRGLVGAEKPRLDLNSGKIFIFSREKEGEIDVRTPAANGALRGTQLFVEVAEGGKSTYQVLEGSVELANEKGRLVLNAGEAGEAVPGAAPRRTAFIEAVNILQWALYYPAVIDPDELEIANADQARLAASLAAYREGDLLEALARLPAAAPTSPGGRAYQAAVLLATGGVEEAGKQLSALPAGHPARRAVQRMIAAVKNQPGDAWEIAGIKSAGEAIAESYFRQAKADLPGARDAAAHATRLAPRNGFAWVRLAELEFSFGRTRQTSDALARGLELTPRNAQAHALHGFVLSAQNCIPEAAVSFERATVLDGALGNGWLGLGLTKIKRGDLAGGRADLQTAATAQPTTSLFHSYLGKAFGMEKREVDSRRDLDLAIRLDPEDPTPWLYSALELQAGNRTNPAITDLERSIALNDNRRLYRSRLLLDQDKAVRGANLARIYQNAGMREVAVREATRAVESDYTNPSAHLFLANSFDALRDPKRIALRYETPWFNELLLSNLLSPVGGGPLSQFVSQQEYSKLLEQDGFGGSIFTEWRSNKESRTAASVFGNHGSVSYGLDAYFRDDIGDRLNSEATLKELYGQLKWQPGPDDIFYFLGKWADQQSGDNFDTYDNQPLSPGFDFTESQEPGLLLAGWNHRWAPGHHTLFLGGRLSAEQRLTDPASEQLLIKRDVGGLMPGFIRSDGSAFTDPAIPPVRLRGDGETLVYSRRLLESIQSHLGAGDVLSLTRAPFAFDSRREFDVNSFEIQQVMQTERNLLLAGGRYQTGEFETTSTLVAERPNQYGGFSTPAISERVTTDFERLSLYGYDYLSLTSDLTLIAGLSWDRMDHPENFRNPPVSDQQREEEKLSGKFGFTYAPSRALTVRGVWAEGLGGVTYDESVRLEPVQIAGFNQAYRTVLSESIAGSVEAPHFTIGGLSVEGSLPTETWWGLSFNRIEQDVDRTIGVFTGYSASELFDNNPAYFADGTPQQLEYSENTLAFTVNQLLGDEWSVGAGYRVTWSKLRTQFTDIPTAVYPEADLQDSATFHELSIYSNWNSPSGWFARFEANWFKQELDDDPAGSVVRSGDDFWQFNAMAGYRFNRNQCEISAGVLNLSDADYRLSPLSPRGEIARERTAVIRCRLSF